MSATKHIKPAEPQKVTREPREFDHCVPEDCVDCGHPTRYWLPDGHTPFCKSCCERRNKKASAGA